MPQPDVLTLPDGAPAGPPQPYCTFRLGDGLYGVDIRLVHSINLPPPLTPIPHAPPAVRGYVNLRGQVQLVLDVKRLLRLGTTESTPETRLVLLQPDGGDPFGVLVDRVGDIAGLRPDQVEKHQPSASDPDDPDAVTAEELLAGVGKLDGELLILLDARRLPDAVRRGLARGEPPTAHPGDTP